MAFARSNSWAAIRLAACAWLLAWSGAAGAEPAAAQSRFAAYAQQSFDEAQARYAKEPGDGAAAWKFARACFDLAEFATNNTQRASLAKGGLAACEQTIARASNSAPAHYYLALNLGQLARTRMLGALRLVNQMEREFRRARDLDERLDCAGPDRGLGLLYREAPSLGSVGSRSKARQHLQRAAELAPHYPANRLNLSESYLYWGEPKGAHRELAALEAIWPAARTNLVGEAWAGRWADWEARRDALKKKLAWPAKVLGAPHDQP
jgi:hypothetical protein